MAHIVSCMLDADANLDHALGQLTISKSDSQEPPNVQAEKVPTPTSAFDKPHVWRMMHQPERKYQLFPKDKQVSPVAGKANLDPEQAFALALGQNGEKTSDKALPGSALRLRMKEHNLSRRRKVSVPDLGPMTTVQEVSMDSPTIPGRPPLHERSISAPGHSFKPRPLVDLGLMTAMRSATPDTAAVEMTRIPVAVVEAQASAAVTGRQPLSPKSLAPLVIPTQTITSALAPKLHGSSSQTSLSRLRSGSTPVDPGIRSARTDESPRTRTATTTTPYTPLSGSTTLTTPRSAAVSAVGSISTVPTPVSAPLESRASSKPWTESHHHTASLSATDLSATPRAEIMEARPPIGTGHRRNHSESGSIMERGRPRKRGETPEASAVAAVGFGLKRAGSKRSKSAERRAFEYLPQGWKAGEAGAMLHPSEAAAVQRQALQQAARFEVLRKDDVDSLSKELRHLDDRTEWLRRTYTSLRAGRRNLHSRICQYLRSPRTAKFSQDSMLKQEEALAELDASIDDWGTKLQQAENRRTRVRQKLLEHVAAAATLTMHHPAGLAGASESLQQAMGFRGPGQSGTANLSTPPRSPTKAIFSAHSHSHSQSSYSQSSYSQGAAHATTAGHARTHSGSTSPSPQRVVAQVPSTILEQPLIEEAAAAAVGLGLELHAKHDGQLQEVEEQQQQQGETFAQRRANMESIRIYADSDVYVLLADVENEISKMSAGVDATAATAAAAATATATATVPAPAPAAKKEEAAAAAQQNLSEDERKQLHRARSHELLSGAATITNATSGLSVKKKGSAGSLPSPTTTTTTAEPSQDVIILTQAVFRPDESVLDL